MLCFLIVRRKVRQKELVLVLAIYPLNQRISLFYSIAGILGGKLCDFDRVSVQDFVELEFCRKVLAD